MNKIKLHRVIGKIVLAVLAIALIFMVGSAVFHSIMLRYEEKVLNEYNVGQIVDLGEKQINVYQMGNPSSEMSILYLHGLGNGDTTVSTRQMFSELSEKYHICVIDRAGNGMSSDTSEKRTVDVIVDEYRQTWKKLQGAGPYVIMAHSIAGMYAEYWASLYPEEVSAIIYLDAPPVESYINEGELSMVQQMRYRIQNYLCYTGLQRILLSDASLLGTDRKQLFNEEEKGICRLLMYRNTYSKATCSEKLLRYQNAQTVLKSRNVSQIPRLYIVADSYEGEYFDDVFYTQLTERYDSDEEKISQWLIGAKEYREKELQYVKDAGNVRIEYISGPHTLYKYSPDSIASVVKDFLNDLSQ